MIRNTVQRQVILAGLQKLNTHPTIEEVYAEVQKEHPAISKTTVYRNLRQLAKDGIIRPVLLLDGLERYDRFTTQHQHFNCIQCGSIIDVEIEFLADIDDAVQKKYGFQIERQDLVLTGICQNCKKVNEYSKGSGSAKLMEVIM